MHVFPQLLQALLVGDAEVLLLVDDEETQPRKLYLLAEQRMRADDDVELAALEPVLDLRQLLRPDQPRRLRDLDRQPAEAVRERLVVLTCKKRRRHHDGDLHAVDGRDISGAQRDLGLAEADVAAHEAIHRPAGAQVFQHLLDARRLILGLLVGEARDELVIGAMRRRAPAALPSAAAAPRS